MHLDLNYAEGSLSKCDEPLCCEEKFGPGKTADDTAGYWGSYGCDIPLRTLDAGVNSMASHDLDFVLWNGDSPPHDLWNQTETT